MTTTRGGRGPEGRHGPGDRRDGLHGRGADEKAGRARGPDPCHRAPDIKDHAVRRPRRPLVRGGRLRPGRRRRGDARRLARLPPRRGLPRSPGGRRSQPPGAHREHEAHRPCRQQVPRLPPLRAHLDRRSPRPHRTPARQRGVAVPSGRHLPADQGRGRTLAEGVRLGVSRAVHRDPAGGHLRPGRPAAAEGLQDGHLAGVSHPRDRAGRCITWCTWTT